MHVIRLQCSTLCCNYSHARLCSDHSRVIAARVIKIVAGHPRSANSTGFVGGRRKVGSRESLFPRAGVGGSRLRSSASDLPLLTMSRRYKNDKVTATEIELRQTSRGYPNVFRIGIDHTVPSQSDSDIESNTTTESEYDSDNEMTTILEELEADAKQQKEDENKRRQNLQWVRDRVQQANFFEGIPTVSWSAMQLTEPP
jgi:hypothetical protein